jgi:hypothetical protein
VFGLIILATMLPDGRYRPCLRRASRAASATAATSSSGLLHRRD